MAVPVENLLRYPALWRIGDVQAAVRAGISTGHAHLDRALPEAGWPLGALTEILAHEGSGEFSLVAPALRAVCDQGKHVALIDPPYVVYARALEAAGLSLPRVLLVDATGVDALWAAEQALRSGACGMVVFWATRGRSPDYRALQRLHGAAAHGAAACMLYRTPDARATPSPAPLRLAVQAQQGRIGIEIVKRRGALSSHPIVLTPFPPHWSKPTEPPSASVQPHPSIASFSG